ncbi:fasciclin domain-containing protein [Marinobacter sediminum]|uniref:fasciclin domain-containing protein n=1 Tax=Marinobacter sediminum TaxID=256323 RepID=UPI00356641AE
MKKSGLFKSMLVSTLFVFSAATALPAMAGHHEAGEKDMMNIVEAASKADNLSTLVTAVKAAGLVETLSGSGPFTVFAPTNEAFAKLPNGTVEALLKPENQDQLKSILTYHVVAAKATSSAAMQMVEDDGGMHEVTTVQGGTFTLMMEGGSLMIEDAKGNKAKVIKADMMQSNGVVHVIDTVLMP